VKGCVPCLITERAVVGEDPGVLGPLMDPQVGLGGEPLLAVGAVVVAPALVHHLHVAAQLEAAGQQLPALRAAEHLLGDGLAPRVQTVLPHSPQKNFIL
jgi:hypothetical protein